jgi:hypothetical protein
MLNYACDIINDIINGVIYNSVINYASIELLRLFLKPKLTYH